MKDFLAIFKLKILDKYIIKKYLSTFLFVVLIFTAISVTIDFSEKIENYLKEACTVKEILLDYTINFMLFINGLLFPIYAMVAVIFFTSRMAYDSEIIAIMNAGAPFKRILRPYMIAATLITFLLLFFNHYIIPNGNKRKLDFERKYIYKNNDKGKKDNVHLFLGDGKKAYVRYYRANDSTARDLRIETIKEGKMTGIMEVVTAQWKGRPNKWQLIDYQIRTFDGVKETLVYKTYEPKDTTINLYPEDFVLFENEKDRMTTPELLKNINNERIRGAFNPKVLEIELHRRTAEAFTIIILTILGLAIAGRKLRGGMGLHLAIGIALGAIYIFLSRFSATFVIGNNTPALLGVWIPNLIFAAVSAYFVKNAQQ